MTAKRKNKETERLSIRCTKSDKRMIEKVAGEMGLSKTRCTVKLFKQANKSLERDKNIASAVCGIQDLVNYTREHHIEDDYIMEECDKIWHVLNL